MNDYSLTQDLIINEIKTSMKTVENKKVEEMVEMICSANKVFVVGVGRVLMMLQAFVKRLNHIGIEAYFVGEINEPAITDKDLLIVGSGSGESVIPVAISKIAKKYNAKIIHIGSNPKSTVGAVADLLVRISCRTKLGLDDEIQSQQPMSSLFEQSLLILCDITAYLIIEKKHIDINTLWLKHANLE